MAQLESKVFNLIDELFADIKSMTPPDGFCSPRDIELTKEVNKKSAVLDCLQDAMRIMVPGFEIKD